MFGAAVALSSGTDTGAVALRADARLFALTALTGRYSNVAVAPSDSEHPHPSSPARSVCHFIASVPR